MELDVFIDSRHCQSFGNITVPVHKHRWQVRMKLAETGDDSPVVVRYSKVLAAVTSTLQPFDGVILNEVYPFNIIEPTHDNIAMYFYNILEDTLAMMDLKLLEMSMWEDHDLVKLITQRNSKLGELLRGEDILKAMRHDLPETVKSKRNPIKGKLVQILSNATRSI
jgi:6-pyruvoyl-tetrahydropterin synthase